MVVILSRFFRLFKVRQENNLEFWVSQGAIVAATVLGVYLAASIGFRQAVRFEDLQDTQKNYYLQSALFAELADNLERAEDIAAAARSGWASGQNEGQALALEDFVWSAMRVNDHTFQVPPPALAAIRRFYAKAGFLTDLIAAGDARAPEAAAALGLQAAEMRSETLPRLQANVAALKAKLEANDVPTD